jgi:uncharacterized membrane protein
MRPAADRLVDDYLRRLDSELRGLPRARRRELRQEIAEHIDEARDGLAAESEADVRNLLERLGEPAEIAAEARERLGVHPRRAGFIEVAAIVLLPVGGVVIPVLGWIAGVILLWVSEAWSVRDKLIGTLVIPGGLLVPVYLVVATGSSATCSSSFDAAGRVISRSCSGGDGSALLQALAAVGIVALVLAPLITAVYLGRRMRRPATPTANAEPTPRAASAL